MTDILEVRVNYLSCIEGKGSGKDIHSIVHKMSRYLLIYYKIFFFLLLPLGAWKIENYKKGRNVQNVQNRYHSQEMKQRDQEKEILLLQSCKSDNYMESNREQFNI